MNSRSVDRAATTPNRSKILFGGAIAFILAAGLTVGLMSRKQADPKQSAQTIEVATAIKVDGTPLPEGPQDPTSTDPAVGLSAPTLTGVTPAGAAISVPTAGHRTLLVVVAHWCPHCQREVPRLVEWQKSGAVPKDLDVVLLSTAVHEEQGNYPPSAWLNNAGVTWPVIVDDAASTGHAAYGGMGFPNLHLIGTDGKVIARASGEMEIADLAAFVTRNPA